MLFLTRSADQSSEDFSNCYYSFCYFKDEFPNREQNARHSFFSNATGSLKVRASTVPTYFTVH